ncbi:MAG: ribosome-associated translation inhibitor RaiA [Chitinophagales bacterium]|nr:ribosome-associated translation inhibitor RaiA [Chitinophagales bacterium]
MNIKIHSIHFNADRKLEDFIQKKLEKVEKITTRIIDVQVMLKLDHNSANLKDKIVEIRLQIPGKTIFAEERSKIFEESVELASASIIRQVKKHKEKIRG